MLLIFIEKSLEMVWVDKVKNININENYIYECFKYNIFFNLSFVIVKDMLLDGYLIKER